MLDVRLITIHWTEAVKRKYSTITALVDDSMFSSIMGNPRSDFATLKASETVHFSTEVVSVGYRWKPDRFCFSKNVISFFQCLGQAFQPT